MLSRKIALTGATSASAVWIAKALKETGWNALSLCPGSEASYTDLKMRRIKWLKKKSEVTFGLRAENDEFVPWIKKHKPAVWIHHYHHMLNYRTSNYDFAQALHVGIKPLGNIVQALKETGCKAIIYSGSYFEPGERGQNSKEPSPYALSKTQVSEELKKRATAAGILFSKIIIPDLTGPLESEDRFLPQAVRTAKNSELFELQVPNQRADHLPMENLGFVYADVAQKLLTGLEDVFRPSGMVCTNNDWLREIEENLIDKLGYKLKTNVAINRSSPSPEKRNIDWARFWENYLYYQKSGEPWRII